MKYLERYPFFRNIPENSQHAFIWESISGIFLGISSGMIIPFITVVARKIDASSTQIAILTAMPFLGGLLSFYWAHITDRIGHMKMVIIPGILGRSLFFLMLFIYTPMPFLIVVSFFHLIFPIMNPAYLAIISHVYPAEYRGRLMSYVRIGIASMTILSTAIAGKLIETWGFQYIFPLGAFWGIISVITFQNIRFTDLPQKSEMSPFRISEIFDILKKNPDFSRYCMAYSAYGFGNLMIEPLAPIFLVDQLKVSNTLVGFLGACQSLFWMISFYFWGILLDKYYPLRVIRWNYTIACLVPVSFIFAIQFSGTSWILLSYLFIFTSFGIRGIQYAGGELSHMKSLMVLSRKDLLPKYAGIHVSLLGIRGTLAPFISVFLLNYLDMQYIFGIVVICMLTGRFFMGKILNKSNQSMECN